MVRFDKVNFRIVDRNARIEVSIYGKLKVEIYDEVMEKVEIDGLGEAVVRFIDAVLALGYDVLDSSVDDRVPWALLKIGKFTAETYIDGHIRLELIGDEYSVVFEVGSTWAGVKLLKHNKLIKVYYESGDYTVAGYQVLMDRYVAVRAEDTGWEARGEKLYAIAENRERVLMIDPYKCELDYVICAGQNEEGEKVLEWVLNVLELNASAIRIRGNDIRGFKVEIGDLLVEYRNGEITIEYNGDVKITFDEGWIRIYRKKRIKAYLKVLNKIYYRKIKEILEGLLYGENLY